MGKKIPQANSWTVAQAKARLSELIEMARHQGPQVIHENGKKAVVIIDATLWDRSQKREREGNFADFLLSSPLRGSSLEGARLKGGLRKVDLGVA